MSKKIKSLIQNQIAGEFDGIKDFMIVSIMGIKGKENNALRAEMLKKNITVRVISNTLAVRAYAAMGVTGLERVLTGPCALVYGGVSVVDLAKDLVALEKKNKQLEIKGACLEGEVLTKAQAKLVATMKTRAEQQGEVVSIALTPGAKVAGVLLAGGGAIAGCLKAMIDKQEEAA